jgi:diguanylate cyclase (GGDEF)-like protein
MQGIIVATGRVRETSSHSRDSWLPRSTDDWELAAEFLELRDSIERGETEELLRKLRELEGRARASFRAMERDAEAVAEANVRIVEVHHHQEELAESLARQNRQLLRQNREMQELRDELQRTNQTLAEANVNAVLLLDTNEEQVADALTERSRLASENENLSAKTLQLEQEAESLADSNAEAIMLLADAQEAVDRLEDEHRSIRARAQQLEGQVFVDELSGLFNRRYLEARVATEFARARESGQPLAAVFLDIDHFKVLNDTHGHAHGDLILREVSRIIAEQVRGRDVLLPVDGDAFAARYGGEEFVLLLPNTGLGGAAAAAERLREAIEDAGLPGGETQPLGRVSISGGVASIHPTDTARELLARADQALYKAKGRGRNRIVCAGEGSPRTKRM